MKSESVLGYSASVLLALAFVVVSVGVRAEEPVPVTVPPESSQVVINPTARSMNINRGYFYVAPLSFMPSKVVVGQPEIVGVDVVGAQPYPHIHLIGLSNGATNLVVFDQSDKIQVAMRLSVSEEVGPKSSVVTQASEVTADVQDSAAFSESSNGAIYSIRVFRALAAEEINCNDEGCNLPNSSPKR